LRVLLLITAGGKELGRCVAMIADVKYLISAAMHHLRLAGHRHLAHPLVDFDRQQSTELWLHLGVGAMGRLRKAKHSPDCQRD
jgi:hypothetical protein